MNKNRDQEPHRVEERKRVDAALFWAALAVICGVAGVWWQGHGEHLVSALLISICFLSVIFSLGVLTRNDP